jgi:hypothetical protein
LSTKSSDAPARIGVIGGPFTFAGSAAAEILEGSTTAEPAYLEGPNELWSALQAGDIDAGLFRAETTSTGPGGIYRLLLDQTTSIRVLAEFEVPFRSRLVVKPGTALTSIAEVRGHGALEECRRQLAVLLPTAQLRATGRISFETAHEVAASDGSLAVVANEFTARTLGLEVAAFDIDDEAIGVWWLVGNPCGALARFPVIPTAVSGDPSLIRGGVLAAIRVTTGDEARLATLLEALPLLAWTPRAVVAVRRPDGAFRYDYLVLADAGEQRGLPCADDELLGLFPSYASAPVPLNSSK